MTMRRLSISLAMALGLHAGQASAGGFVCLVADPIWQGGHATAQAALTTAVDTMGATFAQQSALTNQALMTAMRVTTRQRSLSGEREAVARTNSAQAVAAVYVEQRSAEEIRRAHETYGQQGQMVGGCALIEDLQTVDEAMRVRMDRASVVLTSGAIDSVPGLAVAPLEAAARRLAADTPEAVSAVSFFDPATSSAMRDAYMNNIIGLPFLRPEGGINAVEDELLFMQSRRWEAMRSAAVVSLTAVRAASEEGGSFMTTGTRSMSYLGALDWYIGQFGGGPEYEEWSAALVTKSETGLLKEIARLRAINLQLATYRQESQDRQLATVASLLAGMAVR